MYEAFSPKDLKSSMKYFSGRLIKVSEILILNIHLNSRRNAKSAVDLNTPIVAKVKSTFAVYGMNLQS